ncbi:MAG: PASTA domain-containing protein, partial [Pirellulaceae bacterium]|nr:PASTA domain-containing protein [Pirellulaceae bacterium]
MLGILLLVGAAAADAQNCTAPGCWPGRFYKFDVVAKTGDTVGANTLTGFGDQTSINDYGKVAFVGQVGAGSFEGVFVGAVAAAPVWLSTNLVDSGRTFGRAVQISNTDMVVSRDRINGAPPPTRILVWDAKNPGTRTIVASGGSTGPYSSVLAQPTINAAGQVAFSALDQSSASRLVTPNAALNPPYNNLPLSTPLRPMIDDTGRVVVQAGNQTTSPIRLYQNDLAAGTALTIASTSSEFDAAGQSPGISRDGSVVAFVGNLNAIGAAARGTNVGPGVFIALIEAGAVSKIFRVAGFSTPTGGLGTKSVENLDAFPPPAGTNWDDFCDPGEQCKAIGEIEDNPPAAAGGASVPVYFKTFDPALFAGSSTEWQQRVGVIHSSLGPAGFEGDTIVVSFIATPNVASGLGYFSASAGLWTVRVDLAKSGAAIVPKVQRPVPVIQIGDKLGSAATITGISTYDPIAKVFTDDSGNARAPVPGDHRIALWVSTSDAKQQVLRATRIDTDLDGLADHWERYGIDFDGNGVVDLSLTDLDAANPPSTTHKDIYVEVDYLCSGGIFGGQCLLLQLQHTHQPGRHPFTDNPLAAGSDPIASVVNAFSASPVANPDGANGVDLHVSVDEAIDEVPVIIWGAPPSTANSFQSLKTGTGPCGAGAGVGHLGTIANRADANCSNIIGARRLVTRYAIFGHDYSFAATPANATGSSGVAKIRGNDFLVTLSAGANTANPCINGVDFADWAVCTAIKWGTTFDVEFADLQAGTFMHEFGHTLGLFHGGNDLYANYKPNFLSVMNYAFQFNNAGVQSFNMGNPADCKVINGSTLCRTNRNYDYSNAPKLATLNENSLSEAAGIGGPAGRTLWYLPVPGGFATMAGLSSGALDWNADGAVGPNVALDVSQNGTQESLTGHEEWSTLHYEFHNSSELSLGATSTAPPPVEEPTAMDYHKSTVAILEPALLNVVISGEGNVTSDPANIDCPGKCAAHFSANTLTVLTATAADGSSFSGWGGACSGVAPCQVFMDQARSVSATFIAAGGATVPNVVGLTQAAAATAITNAGLVVGTVTQQSSNAVPAGSVISQNPGAGVSVAAGSGVDLVISTGPAPVNVPNVVGLTQAAATTAITNAGLVVGTVTQQSSNAVPAGSVISQNPSAGTSVAAGSAVDLVISTGPA